MAPAIQRLLLLIVASVLLTDAAWASVVHFDIDLKAYALLGALAAILAAGGQFYGRVRRDAPIAAMLTATAFLVAFSAGMSLLNYLLLTVAGPRIDIFLAATDRMMGANWPAMMAFMAHHPVSNAVLRIAYQSVLPQIAFLIVCLGFRGRCEDIAGLCLAVAVSAAATVAFWTLFPSFGAFSVYRLAPAVANHLDLALDAKYAHTLVALLAHGPGRIAPDSVKGLIGFPSFHCALAAIIFWYARRLAYMRWPFLALDLMMMVSAPIQGGHHVVDVAGGILAAAGAVALADRIVRRAAFARAIPRTYNESDSVSISIS